MNHHHCLGPVVDWDNVNPTTSSCESSSCSTRNVFLQVLHEPDVDYGSSCVTFANCLGLIADWHNANPNHFPIIVMLNQKVQGLAEFLGDEGQRLLTAVMKTSQTPGPDGYAPLHMLCFLACLGLLHVVSHRAKIADSCPEDISNSWPQWYAFLHPLSCLACFGRSC